MAAPHLWSVKQGNATKYTNKVTMQLRHPPRKTKPVMASGSRQRTHCVEDDEMNHQKPKECVSKLIRDRSPKERTSEANEIKDKTSMHHVRQ